MTSRSGCGNRAKDQAPRAGWAEPPLPCSIAERERVAGQEPGVVLRLALYADHRGWTQKQVLDYVKEGGHKKVQFERASGKVEKSSLQNQNPKGDDPKQMKTFWCVERITILTFGLPKWIFILNAVTNSHILTFSISTDGKHAMSQEPS
ncbi:FERM, ARHGEF and pleckstrin domain-containing protein 1 [Lemmus lemmus]